jgi:hypothetical protein
MPGASCDPVADLMYELYGDWQCIEAPEKMVHSIKPTAKGSRMD